LNALTELSTGIDRRPLYAANSANRPLLTIITISYNNRTGLEKTLRSIDNIKSNASESIVIDGNSDDGTKQLLLKVDVPDYKISEPDTGIAHAFNKGLKKATGEYVLFLNSGDVLLSPGFPRILDILKNDLSDGRIYVAKTRLGARVVGKPVSKHRQLFRNHLPHQAMFIKRQLFEDLGGYREDFKLGMDYEWSLRLRKKWSEVRFVDILVSEMETGGRSVTNADETFRQYHRARQLHGISPQLSMVTCYYYTIKAFLRRVLLNKRLLPSIHFRSIK
jgi:glycosyltransferase involved in cell wall biosynthesis